MDFVVILLAIALGLAAALGWGCYRLLVDRGHLLLRLEAEAPAAAPPARRGLPRGAYLNDFALPGLDGRTFRLSDVAGRRLLLVVLQAECLFSRAFARELRDLVRSPDAPLPVVILSGDPDIANPDRLATFAELPGTLVLDSHGQAARLLQIAMTPAGYLIDEGRRTSSHLLTGPEALLAAAQGNQETELAGVPRAMTALAWGRGPLVVPAPLGPGDEAPDLTLPRPDGGMWSLKAQRGRPVTLLFVDAECPPCRQLLAELTDLCDDRLVIVSRTAPTAGDGESVGVASVIPTVVPQGREAARAFGTLQTPAAFAIDATGTISAGPGIGVEEALAVIRGADGLHVSAGTRGREQGGAPDEIPHR
jgi:peroxiredoxin